MAPCGARRANRGAPLRHQPLKHPSHHPFFRVCRNQCQSCYADSVLHVGGCFAVTGLLQATPLPPPSPAAWLLHAVRGQHASMLDSRRNA